MNFAPSSLDRPAQHAAHDVALRRDDQDQQDGDRQKGRRHQWPLALGGLRDRHAYVEQSTPTTALIILDSMVAQMTAGPPCRRECLVAMVLGVPGPVAAGSQTVHWSRVGKLPDNLSDRFGVPVLGDART